MDLSLSQVAILCAILGVASHLGYFIRGEHLRAAPWLVSAAVLLPPLFVLLLVQYVQFTILSAMATTAVGWTAYIASLFTSMTVYRVFFHPLRYFPGRLLSRITQFDHLVQVQKPCDNFMYLDRLHAKYGDIVRTGPNLLSIADPDMVEPVHNRRTNFTKAECG